MFQTRKVFQRVTFQLITSVEKNAPNIPVAVQTIQIIHQFLFFCHKCWHTIWIHLYIGNLYLYYLYSPPLTSIHLQSISTHLHPPSIHLYPPSPIFHPTQSPSNELHTPLIHHHLHPSLPRILLKYYNKKYFKALLCYNILINLFKNEASLFYLSIKVNCLIQLGGEQRNEDYCRRMEAW